MRRTARVVALVAALVLGSAATVAGHPAFPDSHSPVQDTLTDLFNLVGWMSIIITVVVAAAIGYAAIKFRGDPLVKKKGRWFTHNSKLEITWTVVTALVLVFLGVVTAQAMDQIEEAPTPGPGDADIEIDVIGQQWVWSFLYPDGNMSSPDLWVEAGTTVKMRIVSCDVIHSLYIPEFGVKIDTRVIEYTCGDLSEIIDETGDLPEDVQANRFWFRAKSPGEYRFQCAEYCGTAHAAMDGQVHVFEPGTRNRSYGPPPTPVERTLRHVEYVDTGDASRPLAVRPAEIDVTAGDNVRIVVWNNASEEHGFRLGAPYNRSLSSPVPAGGVSTLDFTADRPGNVTFWSPTDDDRANGLEGQLGVTSGTVVEVELTEWAIEVDRSEFEAGESYAFHVVNTGDRRHNFYIGAYVSDRAGRTTEFRTEDIDPGQATWLNVTLPSDDITFDAWCNVPGHADEGMLTDVTVGAGKAQDKQERELLLPGPGPLIVVAALSAAGLWVRRRDG